MAPKKEDTGIERSSIVGAMSILADFDAFALLNRQMSDLGGETRTTDGVDWNTCSFVIGRVDSGETFKLPALNKGSDTIGVSISVTTPAGSQNVGLINGGLRRFIPLYFNGYVHDTPFSADSAAKVEFRKERIGQYVIVLRRALIPNENPKLPEFWTFAVWSFQSNAEFASAVAMMAEPNKALNGRSVFACADADDAAIAAALDFVKVPF